MIYFIDSQNEEELDQLRSAQQQKHSNLKFKSHSCDTIRFAIIKKLLIDRRKKWQKINCKIQVECAKVVSYHQRISNELSQIQFNWHKLSQKYTSTHSLFFHSLPMTFKRRLKEKAFLRWECVTVLMKELGKKVFSRSVTFVNDVQAENPKSKFRTFTFLFFSKAILRRKVFSENEATRRKKFIMNAIFVPWSELPSYGVFHRGFSRGKNSYFSRYKSSKRFP